MKCLKCGQDNASEAKFCGVCGAAMTSSATLAATQSMSPLPAAATGSPRSTAKIIVLGAVVLVVAAVGFAGYKMLGGGGMPSLSMPAVEAPKPPAAEAQKDESPAAPTPQPDAQPAGQGAPTMPPAAEPAKPPEPVTPAPEAAAPKAPATKAPSAPKAATKSPAKAAASPRPDRWAMMAAEMEACKREPFLTRVVCEQKVGQNYCAGYWGLVPQCGGQAK